MINEELLFNLCTYEVILPKESGRMRHMIYKNYMKSILNAPISKSMTSMQLQK